MGQKSSVPPRFKNPEFILDFYSLRRPVEPSVLVQPPPSENPKMKGARLVFSSREVRLLTEQARKNAEMAPFNSDFGAGSRTLISRFTRNNTPGVASKNLK